MPEPSILCSTSDGHVLIDPFVRLASGFGLNWRPLHSSLPPKAPYQAVKTQEEASRPVKRARLEVSDHELANVTHHERLKPSLESALADIHQAWLAGGQKSWYHHNFQLSSGKSETSLSAWEEETRELNEMLRREEHRPDEVYDLQGSGYIQTINCREIR